MQKINTCEAMYHNNKARLKTKKILLKSITQKKYLSFLTVSNSIFAFLALFLACSNSALVSWKRLLTPSSLNDKINKDQN